ncbi:MAG: hypothetical protein ACP5GX_10095, partial [Anaerolineae bacterium]
MVRHKLQGRHKLQRRHELQRWYRWLAVALACLGLILLWQLPGQLKASTPAIIPPEGESGPRVDPELLRALAQPSDEPLRIIVHLGNENTASILSQVTAEGRTSLQKRQIVVTQLQEQL